MSDDNEFEHDNAHVAESNAVEHPDEDVDTSAREHLRVQLQSDVEVFLAQGGKISEIPQNVVADPPKKPQSNYGGQPI